MSKVNRERVREVVYRAILAYIDHPLHAKPTVLSKGPVASALSLRIAEALAPQNLHWTDGLPAGKTYATRYCGLCNELWSEHPRVGCSARMVFQER